MSSQASYGSSFGQSKGAPRSVSPRSTASSASSRSTSSLYAQSANTSRRYGSKSTPVVIHNGGGPNTGTGSSADAPPAGYYQ